MLLHIFTIWFVLFLNSLDLKIHRALLQANESGKIETFIDCSAIQTGHAEILGIGNISVQFLQLRQSSSMLSNLGCVTF